MCIKSVVFGFIAILFSTTLVSAAGLPNTAACRDYANYARSAGAAGTMAPLNRKYQACMRSANHRGSRRTKRRVSTHKCPNGYYKYYIGKTPHCKPDAAQALDAISTAITIFSMFK